MRSISLMLLLAGALAQQPPKVSAVDRNAFTFTGYDLSVHLEGAAMQVRGIVDLRNDSNAARSELALQVSSTLKWASIRREGKPLAFTSSPLTSDIDHTGTVNEAVVTLPIAVAAHSTLQLEVAYQGTIPLSGVRLQRLGAPADVAQHSDWDVLGNAYTAFRGLGYVTWYPVAISPVTLAQGNAVFRALGEFKARNPATLRVRLNPSDLKLLHSGIAVQEGTIDFPLSASTVPLLVLGGYTTQASPSAEIAHLTAAGASAGSLYADVAASSSRLVSGWLGPADQKIQIIQSADAHSATFESGATLITPMQAADPREIAFQLAHSLAHASVQSFRPWIYEGIAHFAQARMREQQQGRAAALAFLSERRPAIALADMDSPASATAQSLINADDEIFYRTKAMFVWWMLRDMVGDEAFNRAIIAYRPQDDKEPAYLQRLFEKESNRRLEPFFDDWVYRDRGLPDFRIVSVYPRQNLKGGTYLVTVQVENLGNAGAEVPIRIHTASGDVTTRLELLAKDKAAARIETNAPPEEVTVNDGSIPESDISNNTFTVPTALPR